MSIAYRILICLFSLPIASLHAQEAFSPANFTQEPQSLQNKITFPKNKGDISLKIPCAAWVTKSGRFSGNVCYSDKKGNSIRFERAIRKAAKRATIKNAFVNGVKKGVWFQYTVEFIKKGDKSVVNAYPNHGHAAEKFGSAYSSAQHYKGGWVKTIVCDYSKHIWIRAVIRKRCRRD